MNVIDTINVIDCPRPLDRMITLDRGEVLPHELSNVWTRDANGDVFPVSSHVNSLIGSHVYSFHAATKPVTGPVEYFIDPTRDHLEYFAGKQLDINYTDIGLRVRGKNFNRDFTLSGLLTWHPHLVKRGGTTNSWVTTFQITDFTDKRRLAFGDDKWKSVNMGCIVDVHQYHRFNRVFFWFEITELDRLQDQTYTIEIWKGPYQQAFTHRVEEYRNVEHHARTFIPIPLIVHPDGTVEHELYTDHHNVIDYGKFGGGITEKLLPDPEDAARIDAAWTKHQEALYAHHHPFYSNMGVRIEGGRSGGDKPGLGPKPRTAAWAQLYPDVRTVRMQLAADYANFNRAFFFRDHKATNDFGEWISVERWPTIHGNTLATGVPYNGTSEEDKVEFVGPVKRFPINPANGLPWDNGDSHATDAFIDQVAMSGRHECIMGMTGIAAWWDAADNNAAVLNPMHSSGPPGRHMTNGQLRARTWENVHSFATYRLCPQDDPQRPLFERFVNDRMIQILGERGDRVHVPHEVQQDPLYAFANNINHAYFRAGGVLPPNNCPDSGVTAYIHWHNGVNVQTTTYGMANFQLVTFCWQVLRAYELDIKWSEHALPYFSQWCILMLWYAQQGKDYFDTYVFPTMVVEMFSQLRWLSTEEALDNVFGSGTYQLPSAATPREILLSARLGAPGHNKDFCRGISAVANAGISLIQAMDETLWCPEFKNLVEETGGAVFSTDWVAVYETLRDSSGMEAEWRLDLDPYRRT